MSRVVRRFIVKYFGNVRNFFMWTAAVVFAIYVIDNFVLTPDRLEGFVSGGSVVRPNNVVNMVQQPPVTIAHAASPSPVVKKPGGSKKCGLTEVCPLGQYAYFIQSGEGRDQSPTICFDGNYAMSPAKRNGARGINVVVINERTGSLVEVRTFDTYVEDNILLRYLRLGIPDNHVILGASLDEASSNLKAEAKSWMHTIGVDVTDKIGFRDSFVFVGQRGLAAGKALQKLEKRRDMDYPARSLLQGCLSLPLGKLTKVDPAAVAKAVPKAAVKSSTASVNCGVKAPCGKEHFPVHLSSGKGNSDGPQICVNGKYVMAAGLNDAGRGFNIAVYSPAIKDVVRVGHFDTYAEDSSNMEIFLEMVKEGEIVLAVTHDDASKNFNAHAKKLFEALGSSFVSKMDFRDVLGFVGQKGIEGHSPIEQVFLSNRLSAHGKKLLSALGSGLVQNLKFRDAWAMITQKGLSGFAETEQIEFAGVGAAWPKPISKSVCVPNKLRGTKIKPDPLANKNEKRRKFCSKYDGYSEFCESEHVDEVLTSAPLTDKSLAATGVLDIPIIIIPGLNHNALRMQLETVLLQPGVRPAMVTVMYDEKFEESGALATLFGFQASKLPGSTKYVHQMQKALDRVWSLYSSAKHVIVLEEEVLLAADFLQFIGALLPVVAGDNTLAGVTAWNPNVYGSSPPLDF